MSKSPDSIRRQPSSILVCKLRTDQMRGAVAPRGLELELHLTGNRQASGHLWPGPSDHLDIADRLAQEGIVSISLKPDTVVETWQRLAFPRCRVEGLIWHRAASGACVILAPIQLNQPARCETCHPD